MLLAVDGLRNKEIARRLGISHRAVEIHEARVMPKTVTNSVPHVANLVKALALAAK